MVSNEYIDLKSPKTLELRDKIKTQLADDRTWAGEKETLTPAGKYGDTIYYIKETHVNEEYSSGLYQKTADGREVKIELPGEEKLSMRSHKLVNKQLYYVSEVNGVNELHAFSFADKDSRKICVFKWMETGRRVADSG